MCMRKIIIILLLFIFLINPICFADDILNENNLDSFIEASSIPIENSKEPTTNSKHIIAIDRQTLSVLYEKDAYSEVAMASTTKIMTAIIVLENCNLDEIVEISKNAANVSGSTLGVHTGAKMKLSDLIYGLMLRSGNDCAVAIAEHISGSTENFAELMNKKAQELNLKHTHFVTPHGLDDENHYTTAYELAILTDYALKNDKFKEIVQTKTTTIYVDNAPRSISNTNELLGNLNGVYGVKTGFTFNAGRCLVSSCNRNGMDIIVVVLGADTKNQRTIDSIKIINYIYDNFQYIDISNYIQESFENYKQNYCDTLLLYKTTTTPCIKLTSSSNYIFPLKANSSNLLSTKFYSITTLSSKVQPGDKIGNMIIYYDNKILTNIDIILENDLIRNSWNYYFVEILKQFNFAFLN